jgi:hypothetical protein
MRVACSKPEFRDALLNGSLVLSISRSIRRLSIVFQNIIAHTLDFDPAQERITGHHLAEVKKSVVLPHFDNPE